MIKLFDPENKFWQFLSKVTDVVCMSLLWLLTSLPLVTIGASTTAFYAFTLDQVRNLEGSLVRSYFTAFRAHWKRATVLWLLQLAGTVFFAADLWAAWTFYLNHQGSVAGIFLLGACGFFALAFLSCCFYLYPILARYDPPLKEIVKGSFLLAVGSLHVTLTLVVLTVLVCVGIYFMSGLFFLWIGLYIFFSAYLIHGVFFRFPIFGADEPEPGDEDSGEDGEEPPALPNDDEKWMI